MLDHLGEARPTELIDLQGEIGVVAKMKKRLRQAIGGRLRYTNLPPAQDVYIRISELGL